MNRTNRQGLEEVNFSTGDWWNLLSISHRYECKHARERSIKEINKLDSHVDNVDKIVMAKKFGVKGWLLPACVALVERQAPLAHVEAEKLGLEMTVLLSEAREKYIRRQQSGVNTTVSPFVSTGGTMFGQPVQPNMNTAQLVKEVLRIE